MIAELTIPEMRLATYAAVDVYARTVWRKATASHGAPTDPAEALKLHIIGMLGEAALAKALGLWWMGDSEIHGPDVAQWHVRAVTRPTSRLIVHDNDPDEAAYVLVDISRLPVCVIVGWIYGKDAKQPEHWQNPGTNRPAYFVPRHALNTTDTVTDLPH